MISKFLFLVLLLLCSCDSSIESRISGCLDINACNYNQNAIDDDDSCIYLDGICDTCVQGTIVDNDSDDDNICNNDEIIGCENPTACNFNPSATDEGECEFIDGICDTCENGLLIDNDIDNDGICDADDISGCMDEGACNYNENAIDDDDSCIYLDGICDTCVQGTIVDNDSDDDNICNNDEIIGCENPTACNFNPSATDEGECEFIDGICDTCENGLLIDNDFDNDGICNDEDDCMYTTTNDDICNLNIELPYSEQDLMMDQHLDLNFDICYGSDTQTSLKIGDFFGKVIHFNLSASW